MRTRTVLGAVTSALLIGLWSAPAALAAEKPDDEGKAPPTSSSAPEPDDKDGGSGDGKAKRSLSGSSSSASESSSAGQVAPRLVQPRDVEPKAALTLNPSQVRPGGQFLATGVCVPGSGTLTASHDVSFSGDRGTVSENAGAGDVDITLTCVNGDKRAETTRKLTVLAKEGRDILPGPGGGPAPQVRAKLSVPDQVYPGERFRADVVCSRGPGSLSAPFVNFQGLDGLVDQGAREGRIEVLLRCGENDDARAYFYVKKKFDGRPWLSLDPRSGVRGDEVDIRAYCPGNGRGRFEADGLVDTRLNLDGDRLTGDTHVENEAPFGRTHGRLICDNGDRASERFYVERDEHDRFLDIDPNHGKRGEEIDIRVHCDRDLRKLESDVLDDIDLDRDGDKWWKYHGTTHVDSDADYGEHTVRVKCGEDWLEDDFFVQREDSEDGDDDSGEQSGLYPKGGVETGGGPTAGGGPVPAGALVLGLTGVLGAALAGAGGCLEAKGAGR